MSIPVTQVIVRDTPPPRQPVMTIGHLYACGPQETVVFKTESPQFTADESEDVVTDEDSDDDVEGKSFIDDAEAKVVRGRRGRRPGPQVTEGAEQK